MSIATESQQARALRFGRSLLQRGSKEARLVAGYAPSSIDVERAGIAQLILSSMMLAVDGGGEVGNAHEVGLILCGAGAAIGSYLAQKSPEVQAFAMSALTEGMQAALASAREEFNPKGAA